MSTPDPTVALRTVAVLGRDGMARQRLCEALQRIGTPLAIEADPSALDPQTLRAAAPAVVLVALEPAIEAGLAALHEVLDTPGLSVIFDDVALLEQRDGWQAQRWQRHLAAKLYGHDDVLPARPPRDPVAAEAEAVEAGHADPLIAATGHARAVGVVVPAAASWPRAPVVDSGSVPTAAVADRSCAVPTLAPSTALSAAAGGRASERASVALAVDSKQAADAAAIPATAETAFAAAPIDPRAAPPELPPAAARASLMPATVAESGLTPATAPLSVVSELPIAASVIELRAAPPEPLQVAAANPLAAPVVDPGQMPLPAPPAARGDTRAEAPVIGAAADRLPMPIIGAIDARADRPFGDLPDASPRTADAVALPALVLPTASTNADGSPNGDVVQLGAARFDGAFVATPSPASASPLPPATGAGWRLPPPVQRRSMSWDREGSALTPTELALLDLEIEHEVEAETHAMTGAVLLFAGVGGPDALRRLLAALPAGFPRAVLLRMTLDGGQYINLVRQMARVSALPVELAEPGRTLQPGRVYVVGDGLMLQTRNDLLAFAASEFSESLLASLPPTDSAVLLLSGASAALVDEALALAAAGGWVAGQSGEGCYDPAAALRLAEHGLLTTTPNQLAQALRDRWPD